LSSHEVIVSLIGVQVLEIEEAAHRFLTERGLPIPPGWTPIPRPIIRRARLIYATYPFSPWMSSEELDTFRAEAPIGYCAAVALAVNQAVFLRPLLHDRDAAYFARLRAELAADGSCDLEALLPLWRIWDAGFPDARDPAARHAQGDEISSKSLRSLRSKQWRALR
jgi:hypothetical protein